MHINTTSAFAAAQQAVAAFETLPASASRTFIYTGNALNTTTMAPLLDLGVGKSATAHVVQVAAAAYRDKGFKYAPTSFFFLFSFLSSLFVTPDPVVLCLPCPIILLYLLLYLLVAVFSWFWCLRTH